MPATDVDTIVDEPFLIEISVLSVFSVAPLIFVGGFSVGSVDSVALTR